MESVAGKLVLVDVGKRDATIRKIGGAGGGK